MPDEWNWDTMNEFDNFKSTHALSTTVRKEWDIPYLNNPAHYHKESQSRENNWDQIHSRNKEVITQRKYRWLCWRNHQISHEIVGRYFQWLGWVSDEHWFNDSDWTQQISRKKNMSTILVVYDIVEAWDIIHIQKNPTHMKISDIVTGTFSYSKDISRYDVLGIGNVVVNIGGITSRHWPQVWINVIFPANRRVKHHGVGNFRNCADQPFRYTILIMHIDATINNVFIMLKNVLKNDFKWSCFL